LGQFPALLQGISMRVYFMKGGHILAVELLRSPDDAERIAEARTLFENRTKAGDADGFEVWDGPRFVYRFPEKPFKEPGQP
jgi:hypothetical protein